MVAWQVQRTLPATQIIAPGNTKWCLDFHSESSQWACTNMFWIIHIACRNTPPNQSLALKRSIGQNHVRCYRHQGFMANMEFRGKYMLRPYCLCGYVLCFSPREPYKPKHPSLTIYHCTHPGVWSNTCQGWRQKCTNSIWKFTCTEHHYRRFFDFARCGVKVDSARCFSDTINLNWSPSFRGLSTCNINIWKNECGIFPLWKIQHVCQTMDSQSRQRKGTAL